MLYKLLLIATLATAEPLAPRVDYLPTEVTDEMAQESIQLEGKHLSTIKQSDAEIAVALLNNEIMAEVVKAIGFVPREIELRPPEALLAARVGHYTVPVFVFTKFAPEPIGVNYTVDIIDVNECTDTDLPEEWQHECNGTFTSCNNLNGTYECRCVAGTLALTPCKNAVASSECVCGDGNIVCGDGQFSCSGINECQTGSNDCSESAVCENIDCADFEGMTADPPTCVGSFDCSCRAGFEGDGSGDEGCVNVDECETGANNCHAAATCTDVTPSAENWDLQFTCACKGGFTGDGIDICSPAKLCQLVGEAGLCHELAHCEPCYEGEGETDDVNCRSSPRPEVIEGRFGCACAKHYKGTGFSGGDGCTAIDYCTDPDNVHDCNEHATCSNLGEGKYECTCAEGFKRNGDGQGAEGCEDIDECSDVHLNQCHYGADCINQEPGYTCVCKDQENWIANNDENYESEPGFGPVGCIDTTPPKAFLRCSLDARLQSLNHDGMDILAEAIDNEDIANCTPEYEVADNGPQSCVCANGADTYPQYSKYTEKGMIVHDDNVAGISELRQRYSFDLPFADADMVLTQVGKYKSAVKYDLVTPGHSSRHYTWLREIEVVPVDECTDESLGEFMHKCHPLARCINTDMSYDCECYEGFQCEECDGFQTNYGMIPSGPGCSDSSPPVILVGFANSVATTQEPVTEETEPAAAASGGSSEEQACAQLQSTNSAVASGASPAGVILETQDCMCGVDGAPPMPPTAEFMAQNKMLVCAYDTSVEKMPDGSFDTVQIPLRSYALPAQLINCSDIPAAVLGNRQSDEVCRGNPTVWKIEYTAVDASGNVAAGVAHYVVQRKIDVLVRLLELEAFVADAKKAQGQRLEALDAGMQDQNSSYDVLISSLETFVVLFAILVASLAFYFGFFPKIFKMVAVLCYPGGMRRSDFEEGYDFWLRVTSCGFKGQQDRLRSIENEWATLQDSR